MTKEYVYVKEVNEQNWYECCQLTLSQKQQLYMESNAVSIAQAAFDTKLKCYAIYLHDSVVGFAMFRTEKEELDGCWIYRIMIDEKQQRKGIGTDAVKQLLDEMCRLTKTDKIIVGYHPDNTAAHRLYESLGCVNEGHCFGKEMAVIKYVN
ncbi:GNAT family N-acetyltransferase [Bacillus sp. A015]